MNQPLPGKYQLSKLTIGKIKALVENCELDDAFIDLLKNDDRSGVNEIAHKIIRKRERAQRQLERQREMSYFEDGLRKKGKGLIAGVDEAGRGPLAGPVVAAAVVLPDDFYCPGLDDSKKIPSHRREELFEKITEHAVTWGIGLIDNVEIDNTNILSAAMRAMRDAVGTMKFAPDVALVDGDRSPRLSCDERLVVSGDSRCRVIAAASIIAKVTRDRIMRDLDAVYPQYGFASHKGYGAGSHVDAIRHYGPCDIHRISFKLVPRVAPRGTTAEVLKKRLLNAPNREEFRRTVRAIARMREYINAHDIAVLRDIYRSCYRRFSQPQ